MSNCSIDDCNVECVKYKQSSLCNKHYQAHWKSKNPAKRYPRSRRQTSERRAWNSMMERCYHVAHHAYKNYGGRGITVCPRWQNDPDLFLKDMGPKPTSKHSLDRIDNELGYEPSNCRWATSYEQVHNRRNSKRDK